MSAFPPFVTAGNKASIGFSSKPEGIDFSSKPESKEFGVGPNSDIVGFEKKKEEAPQLDFEDPQVLDEITWPTSDGLTCRELQNLPEESMCSFLHQRTMEGSVFDTYRTARPVDKSVLAKLEEFEGIISKEMESSPCRVAATELVCYSLFPRCTSERDGATSEWPVCIRLYEKAKEKCGEGENSIFFKSEGFFNELLDIDNMRSSRCSGGTKYAALLQGSNDAEDVNHWHLALYWLKNFQDTSNFPPENIVVAAHAFDQGPQGDGDILLFTDTADYSWLKEEWANVKMPDDYRKTFRPLPENKINTRFWSDQMTGARELEELGVRVLHSTPDDEVVLAILSHGAPRILRRIPVLNTLKTSSEAGFAVGSDFYTWSHFKTMVRKMAFSKLLVYHGPCFARSFYSSGDNKLLAKRLRNLYSKYGRKVAVITASADQEFTLTSSLAFAMWKDVQNRYDKGDGQCYDTSGDKSLKKHYMCVKRTVLSVMAKDFQGDNLVQHMKSLEEAKKKLADLTDEQTALQDEEQVTSLLKNASPKDMYNACDDARDEIFDSDKVDTSFKVERGKEESIPEFKMRSEKISKAISDLTSFMAQRFDNFLKQLADGDEYDETEKDRVLHYGDICRDLLMDAGTLEAQQSIAKYLIKSERGKLSRTIRGLAVLDGSDDDKRKLQWPTKNMSEKEMNQYSSDVYSGDIGVKMRTGPGMKGYFNVDMQRNAISSDLLETPIDGNVHVLGKTAVREWDDYLYSA